MPFVHLANGDVVSVSQEDLDDEFGHETPKALTRDGKQSSIIGVYPDDVEVETDNDDDDNDAENKREDETE
jgi:hypothetical protein